MRERFERGCAASGGQAVDQQRAWAPGQHGGDGIGQRFARQQAIVRTAHKADGELQACGFAGSRGSGGLAHGRHGFGQQEVHTGARQEAGESGMLLVKDVVVRSELRRVAILDGRDGAGDQDRP